MRPWLGALASLACLAGLAGTLPCATASVLQVGPGRAYDLPSAAAAAAEDGDTVEIAPGSYFDCAIWRASGLTIIGAGPGVEITDKACGGKAAFVIQGDGVTVRNLGFARIRVADGNGAGIRAEGQGLSVIDSRFDNNQVGILASGTAGTLRIAGSTFTANGASAEGRPNQAVLCGGIDLLRIENSGFEHARGGGHIASSARRTELAGNRLTDEGGRMSGPLVSVSGGALLLDGNTVSLSATAASRPGAVLVTGAVSELTVRGNTLLAPDGAAPPLVRNWSSANASASANTVPSGAEAVSDSGATYHRLRAWAAVWRDTAKASARHLAGGLARRLGLMP